MLQGGQRHGQPHRARPEGRRVFFLEEDLRSRNILVVGLERREERLVGLVDDVRAYRGALDALGIRQALANNLKAVVAQKLIKSIKPGVGRVPTNEIMIVNPTIRKLIIPASSVRPSRQPMTRVLCRRDRHLSRKADGLQRLGTGARRNDVAYIITRLCRDCLDTGCVAVCPVDCIYKVPGEDQPVLQSFVDIDLERCIGCELCAWACPADAIYVEGADNTDEERYSPGERYGRVYQINYLRCIFCGLCIEACPTRALTMTNEFELADDNRADLIYEKKDLLAPLLPGMAEPPHVTLRIDDRSVAANFGCSESIWNVVGTPLSEVAPWVSMSSSALPASNFSSKRIVPPLSNTGSTPMPSDATWNMGEMTKALVVETTS